MWSTDWFMHPAPALDRIDSELQNLLQLRREESRRRAETEQERVAKTELPPQTADAAAHPSVEEEDEDEADPARQEIYASHQPLDQPEAISDFQDDAGGERDNRCDAALFFEPSYSPLLMRLIDRVVATHGPISEAMLYRHITRLHGWQRAGRRIQERIMACIGENECRKENGNLFIWKPGSYQRRLPFRANLHRAPRDIPQAEILGQIAARAKILQCDDPAKEIATLIGLGRLSADTRAYLEACIAEHERTRDETDRPAC